MPEMVFRRRRLPHQDVEGHPVFITSCLEGSLSASGLSQIDAYRRELDHRRKPHAMSLADWEQLKRRLLFGFVDNLLDGHSPVASLQDDAQAKIVRDAFLNFADERYTLLAFVVMPSHHHWLFLPNVTWSALAVKRETGQSGRRRTPREIISNSIQSYTATMCNRVRGSKGVYWQHETFDHWARDEAESMRIIRYIEMNPVKAGLARSPETYAWSSASIRAQLRLQPGQAIPKVAYHSS
ncbi:hypothetical protein [Planctomycetes bacterium TBK1r]|uniref:Transposase IS200-like domain-containing protein n=1 Tax=Stieleria magnilauensis TaxID=2527963 RepID=A0ABX5XSF9_9BACT|nr:hypothetical protein TBK1r_38850 [Planctomycetes bacterium TBK1r]